MTRKVYKTAMGKDVDLGALILQNEQVRAVGNMNVNARGDLLDSANRVIDQKNRQVQRQYQKTATNVSADVPVHSSNVTAKRSAGLTPDVFNPTSDADDEIFNEVEDTTVQPVAAAPAQDIPVGGLAAAIARSRVIKQEKEKTIKQKQQEQGLKKI